MPLVFPVSGMLEKLWVGPPGLSGWACHSRIVMKTPQWGTVENLLPDQFACVSRAVGQALWGALWARRLLRPPCSRVFIISPGTEVQTVGNKGTAWTEVSGARDAPEGTVRCSGRRDGFSITCGGFSTVCVRRGRRPQAWIHAPRITPLSQIGKTSGIRREPRPGGHPG